MKLAKCNKDFISEIDHFLQDFDAQHPELSPAQAYERKNSLRISRLRDHAEAEQGGEQIWKDF